MNAIDRTLAGALKATGGCPPAPGEPPHGALGMLAETFKQALASSASSAETQDLTDTKEATTDKSNPCSLLDPAVAPAAGSIKSESTGHAELIGGDEPHSHPDAPNGPMISVQRPDRAADGGPSDRANEARTETKLNSTEEGRTVDTLGAAMLQNWLSQSSTAPSPVLATSPAPTPRIHNLQEVIVETVSRVLVSDPLRDHRREVRIELAKDVLPETSIHLWREAGRLHVEFSSPRVDSQNRLQDRLPSLANALQEQTPQAEPPIVTLRADTGGKFSDGRSRQRYRAIDETEESA